MPRRERTPAELRAMDETARKIAREREVADRAILGLLTMENSPPGNTEHTAIKAASQLMALMGAKITHPNQQAMAQLAIEWVPVVPALDPPAFRRMFQASERDEAGELTVSASYHLREVAGMLEDGSLPGLITSLLDDLWPDWRGGDDNESDG